MQVDDPPDWQTVRLKIDFNCINGKPSNLPNPRPRGAAGNTEDGEVDSCRRKDHWVNKHKLCQCLIEREEERYRLRNPLIALSLKDTGGQIG